MTREFDIVIFGATSFVAKRVIQHFLDNYGVGKGVRWAIAGRNQQALEYQKKALGPTANGLSILIADANDLDALKAMCLKTKVVLTMAGPYASFGELLVRACAETGTDYADLTGESPWVAQMINRYEQTAKKTGARIIHCCGYDSVPSDLGVYFLQQEAIRRFSKPCEQVKLRILKGNGNPPGGTYATMMDTVKRATESSTYRHELLDPYLLCPKSTKSSHPQSLAITPSYDPDLKQWTAFWIMGMINNKIVHRSNALSNNSYGPSFEYEEKLAVGKGLLGNAASLVVSGVFIGFFTAAALPPTRYLINNYVIPKPGEGANLKKLKTYSYEMSIIGTNAQQQSLEVRVTGQGDPAVYSTSRMIAEAGMTMAFELDQVNRVGGFWTPATLLGDKLIARLRQYGQMTFEVHHSHPKK